MKKSKLDLLREENEALRDKLEELESTDLDLQSTDGNIGKLDISTIDKLMKFELISEHWEELKLEDLEYLVKKF